MAANTSPIFPLEGHTPSVRLSSANTLRDGSGSLATLVTADSNGTRVDEVQWRSASPIGTANSAMVGRVFVTDTSGNNPMIVGEIAITAATPSISAIGATNTFSWREKGGLFLKPGQILKVAQSAYVDARDQMDVTSMIGNY